MEEPKPKRRSPLPHHRKAHSCRATKVLVKDTTVKELMEFKSVEDHNRQREELAKMVLNRAMKGVHQGNPKGNEEEVAIFCDRFRTLAFWVADMMPRSLSASVGAATLKAALYYGVEEARRFCETLAKGNFNGADDPAHLLWKSLTKNRGKENATENYRRTVCAARAFCEGRKVVSIIPAKTDIFEWGPGLSVPKDMQESVRAILEWVRKKGA